MSLTKVSYSMITGAVVNVLDYGATGDGTTDDTTAIQAAIVAAAGKTLYFPAGIYLFTGLLNITSSMTICGEGDSTQLKPSNVTGNTIRVDASRVTIKDLQIKGTTPGTIAVGQSGLVFFTTIQNVYFEGVSQCVWIFTAQYVNVNNCTFNGTGYGIIQQVGFSSSFVLISNCFAINMVADFVEANCTVLAPSEFWTITDCQFTGSLNFPTPATEQRFVGITSVANVVITNNIVKNVNGDAAIHLEDTLGQTIISNNIFEINSIINYDIYLSSKNSKPITDIIINKNIFVFTTGSNSNGGIKIDGVEDSVNNILIEDNFIKNNPLHQ
jgi:hypothetical protein